MRIDTFDADGEVEFHETYFEFIALRPYDEKYNFKVNYDDVKDIKISFWSFIKKTVIVETNDKKKMYFFMYKDNTFIALVNAGKKRGLVKDEPKNNAAKPISPEDLDTLTKLNQLHKDGVLTEEELAQQKEIIMKKYR